MNRISTVFAFVGLCVLSGTVMADTPEPADGVLVLAGQNLRATHAYYYDERLPKPAGFSDYISYDVDQPYAANAPDAPRSYRGNEALLAPTNWGAGVQCVDCILQEPALDPAVVNIGFYMAGPKDVDGQQCRGTPKCNAYKIANGEYDAYLDEFARWAKSLNALVLLRIGYEFDGEWNNYDPAQFKAAFKYIHQYMDNKGVDNIEYVLHSVGAASRETLLAYYPEPDEASSKYVDWIGYSYFTIDPESRGVNELALARERGIKAFIGEAAPHTGDCAKQIDIATNPALAMRWIDGFISHIERNKDVIGAIAYINADWSDTVYSPMWTEQTDQGCNGFFAQSNSRLNDNDQVIRYWAKKISAPLFINQDRAREWLKKTSRSL